MRFDSYHPTINLMYFVSVIAFSIVFDHPVFFGIGLLASFAYSVKLNGRRSLLFNFCLFPLGALYTVWYAYYNHFGITVLGRNFIGNSMTLEAIAVGASRAVRVITVIMFLTCMFAVFTTDKVVYLFGRISPKLSLFLAIILRMVPRIKEEARHINNAQKGIGRGAGQGNVFQRIAHVFRELSMLITWMLENFLQSTYSMKSRGYTLKGRTAFSIYRFDNRDRSFVLLMISCLVWVAAGWALDQTRITYDPQLIMNRVTPVSYLFYLAYATLLLLPMLLQIIGELRFAKSRRRERIAL